MVHVEFGHGRGGAGDEALESTDGIAARRTYLSVGPRSNRTRSTRRGVHNMGRALSNEFRRGRRDRFPRARLMICLFSRSLYFPYDHVRAPPHMQERNEAHSIACDPDIENAVQCQLFLATCPRSIPCLYRIPSSSCLAPKFTPIASPHGTVVRCVMGARQTKRSHLLAPWFMNPQCPWIPTLPFTTLFGLPILRLGATITNSDRVQKKSTPTSSYTDTAIPYSNLSRCASRVNTTCLLVSSISPARNTSSRIA